MLCFICCRNVHREKIKTEKSQKNNEKSKSFGRSISRDPTTTAIKKAFDVLMVLFS